MNDSVVTIRLTKPFAPFLAVLTMPYAWIVPYEAVRAYGANFGRHPVGTGPFQFHAWTQDIELLLERNTQYFKTDERGERGFGFDPLFVPDDGDGRTFSEMGEADKNLLSHRGRAFRALVEALRGD